MKVLVQKDLLKADLDRIRLIEILLGIFFYLSQIQFCIESGNYFSLIWRTIVSIPLAYLYFRLRSRFFYSLWTFNFIFFTYIAIDLVRTFWMGYSYTFLLNIVSMVCLIYLTTTLFNPVFFPFISWWEYDFRNFKDLKIKVHRDDKVFDGRLCDLKDDLASLACFEDLDFEKPLKITVKEGDKIVEASATILSKRLYSIGRPLYYGIKLDSNSSILKKIKKSMKKNRVQNAR